jgi:hypothetical protein
MKVGRRLWEVLLLPLLTACRAPTPGILVGESQHFRLFVDPALMQDYSITQGQSSLDALETDWTDKASMLHTPEGKVSYYLLAPADVAAACSVSEFGGSSDAGCTWPDTLEIDAAYLPHQHELMHAYMALLSSARKPIALIAEGAAQSLGCATDQGTPFSYAPPWQQVAIDVAAASSDVYYEGGLLSRYLIRTQGIDAFVRYYEQAPESRDPAVFAANFEAFWEMTIDEAWTEMHVPPAGSGGMDQTICPCSLPPLVPDSQTIAYDSPANPYWTLPPTAGKAIALTSPGGSQEVTLEDCAGITPKILGVPGSPLIADLQTTTGVYALLVASATVGTYVSDDCASTTPYPVSADLVKGQGAVEFVVDRKSSGPLTVYFEVQVPAPAQLALGGLTEVCDTCSFNQGNCQPVPGSGATVSVQGTFYVRYTYPAVQPYDPNPNVVTGGIQFTN